MDSHRSSKINRNIAQSVEVVVGEEVDQTLVGRAINDKPMGSILGVMR